MITNVIIMIQYFLVKYFLVKYFLDSSCRHSFSEAISFVDAITTMQFQARIPLMAVSLAKEMGDFASNKSDNMPGDTSPQCLTLFHCYGVL